MAIAKINGFEGYGKEHPKILQRHLSAKLVY